MRRTAGATDTLAVAQRDGLSGLSATVSIPMPSAALDDEKGLVKPGLVIPQPRACGLGQGQHLRFADVLFALLFAQHVANLTSWASARFHALVPRRHPPQDGCPAAFLLLLPQHACVVDEGLTRAVRQQRSAGALRARRKRRRADAPPAPFPLHRAGRHFVFSLVSAATCPGRRPRRPQPVACARLTSGGGCGCAARCHCTLSALLRHGRTNTSPAAPPSPLVARGWRHVPSGRRTGGLLHATRCVLLSLANLASPPGIQLEDGRLHAAPSHGAPLASCANAHVPGLIIKRTLALSLHRLLWDPSASGGLFARGRRLLASVTSHGAPAAHVTYPDQAEIRPTACAQKGRVL
ncbi:hypothetical protein P154DRAFT_571994 [Amniculicola lignicola CBS 123094]|uniref:Uncharacterized protein n=1 Tax=Amniculicola lignicola CBS 123094 TaxID=1392246 RepID=A0A6A5WUL5_9PLEO|nr:hypothetical protein P154DRAFT_571994 [Amniculicola lignicola CBS 123094]